MMRPLMIATLLLLNACGLNHFDVEVKGETVVSGDLSPLPGLLSTFPAIGSFTNMDFNTNQEFKNQGVTKDQVRTVKAKRISLKVMEPTDGDFSFLESLQFYAQSGESELLIA